MVLNMNTVNVANDGTLDWWPLPTAGTIAAVPGMTAPLITTPSAGCCTPPLDVQELRLQSPLLSPVPGGVGTCRSVHSTPRAPSTHSSPGRQLHMGHGGLEIAGGGSDGDAGLQLHVAGTSKQLQRSPRRSPR